MNRVLPAGLLAILSLTSAGAGTESLPQQVARLEKELRALEQQINRVAATSGQQGAKGSKGERGEQGPPGPKGEKGDPGPAGTSVLPLIFYNKNGEGIISLGSSKESGVLKLSNAKGNALISMKEDFSGGGALFFHDEKGKIIVSIKATPEGRGLLTVSDPYAPGRGTRPEPVQIGSNTDGGFIFVYGKLTVNGELISDYADVLEMTTRRGVEPGTVMAVAGSKGRIAPSTGPYDRRVVGVISGAGGLRPGSVIGSREDGSNDLPVAVSGQVAVRVCLEGGSIEPGDLLVASSQPGIAMRAADPHRAVGAVVGKALESFGSGQEKEGLVRMMVMLR